MRPGVRVSPEVAEPDVVAPPDELEGEAGAHHEVGRAALEAVLQEGHRPSQAIEFPSILGCSLITRCSPCNPPWLPHLREDEDFHYFVLLFGFPLSMFACLSQ